MSAVSSPKTVRLSLCVLWGILGVGVACAGAWAPGTVWPARLPLRIRVQVTQNEVGEWMAAELGRTAEDITEEETLAFLSAAGHALGLELGDVEEALGLREQARRTEGIYRVWIVARNALITAEQGPTLRDSALFKHAARISADVGWAAGEVVSAQVAANPAIAMLATGEWGSVDQVLGQIEALAALDPGWLLPPSPALEAWRARPGQGKEVTALQATRALGVYTNSEQNTYALWDAERGGWSSVLLFQGKVTENGQPLPGATTVLRFAEGRGTPARELSRLDVTATGPGGEFFLALRGEQAEQYANQPVDLLVGVRKWGYKRAQITCKMGDTQVTEVGEVRLERSMEGEKPLEIMPADLLLKAPPGYRTLASSASEDGGAQRFLLYRTDRLPGSTRLFSSSSEITYTFERNEGDFEASRWVRQTLDAETAQRARRTPATRNITAHSQVTPTGWQTVVTESGQWELSDGTRVYSTSEMRILAFVTEDYHACLQVTALGSSNRADNRDPQGIVAAAERIASDLGREVEQKLRTRTPAREPAQGGGTWLEAERLTRLFTIALGLQKASVLLENGEFDPLPKHMPLAGQPIRIEEQPATFTLSDEVEVTAEPGSLVRFSFQGRLRLVKGRFYVRTPLPSTETDQALQHLGWLIHQAQQENEDFRRSVERAVELGYISAAYGNELLSLSRNSALRSLYRKCEGLAEDEVTMLAGRMPVLIFGESDLLIESDDVATLQCRTGRALLADSAFIGVACLQAGDRSLARPGEAPTGAGAE
ncbi:MAG: hypothetical protein ACUVX8_00950 [Candidatus Zipacnadales bacterium]